MIDSLALGIAILAGTFGFVMYKLAMYYSEPPIIEIEEPEDELSYEDSEQVVKRIEDRYVHLQS